MADSPLLNDYELNIKVNNSTPQPINTHVLIVIDQPDSLDYPVSNDATLVLIKTLQADTVITFTIAVLTIK